MVDLFNQMLHLHTREVNAREDMETRTGMTEEITNGNATGMMIGLRLRGPGERLTQIKRRRILGSERKATLMRKTTTMTRGAVAEPVEQLLLACSCSDAQLLQKN